MLSKLPLPLIYLITSGTTTVQTTPESPAFKGVLSLISAAVAAGVSLIQIREKDLSALTLYELTCAATLLTRGSSSKLLVNDRADIAASAGADGVHLTATSLPARVVRDNFGSDFIIGTSTHSVAEFDELRAWADFAVFGPVFETPSKTNYGQPQGLEGLRTAARAAGSLPLLAIGGISRENVGQCFRAGACGVAAIRLLSDPLQLPAMVHAVRNEWRECER